MRERFGDMRRDGTLADKALGATERDQTGRFLVREVRALAKRAGIRPTPVQVARAASERLVGEKRIRDLRPGVHRSAEARMARQAVEAIAAQDWTTAHDAKRKQLLNHYLAMESTKARERSLKNRAFHRRFAEGRVRSRIGLAGESYLDQIDALHDRFDFRRISDKAADRRQALADWITEREEAGEVVTIDEDLRNDAFRTPWRNLTVNQLDGLTDAVQNIDHLAKLKLELLTVQGKRELEARVGQAVETIRENARTTKPREIETRDPAEQRRTTMGDYFASHRKLSSLIREMDGMQDGGTLWELLVRPLNEKGDFEADERAKVTMQLSEIFQPYLGFGEALRKTAAKVTLGTLTKPSLRQKFVVPGTNISLSHEARLMVALNMGNAVNEQRILDGHGWSAADGAAILDTLTPTDVEFLNQIWEAIDSYWPEIAAKQKRVAGVAEEKVEAVPRDVPGGHLRGGYFPISFDERLSPRASANIAADAAKQAMRGAYTRASTRRGHTKARFRGDVVRPIRLDFGVIFEHFDQVIHDLAFHEWLIDANKIVGDRRVQSAILDGYGFPVLRQIQHAIEDVAAGSLPAQTSFDRAMNYLRKGSSISGMGFNVITALLQPYGLTQSMVRIGPKWVGRGLMRWMRDAATMENTAAWIADKSTFMKLRPRTQQREINEIQNRVGGGDVFSPVMDAYFYMIVKMQLVADIPTWLGAYEKAMDADGNEARAVALADQAVLDAQGGGQIKDLAQIQRGSPLQRLWTNFYSFFNTTFNLTAESWRRTNFKQPREVGRFAVDMLLLYTAPAVLTEMMRDAIQGSGDDDADLPEKLVRWQLEYLAGTMVGLREFSGFIAGYYTWDGPAGTRFFASAGRAMRQLAQGEADEAQFRAVNQAAGILFHYPAVTVDRFTRGVVALEEGESSNPAVLLTGPRREQ